MLARLVYIKRWRGAKLDWSCWTWVGGFKAQLMRMAAGSNNARLKCVVLKFNKKIKNSFKIAVKY